MNDADLESLFLRFRDAGDPSALATLFDRTAPELGRVALHLAGGDANAAGDLLQTTFLTAITHAARWDATRPLLPWLLGMLANHARRLRRARRLVGDDGIVELLASDDPVRAALDGEMRDVLARSLQRVPTPFREAVALHVLHGLSAKEIAESLGRPAGTVRTQIVRGLDRLRSLLPAGLASGAGALLLSAEQVSACRRVVLQQLPPPVVPRVPVARWTAAVAAMATIAGVVWWSGTLGATPPSVPSAMPNAAVATVPVAKDAVVAREAVALPEVSVGQEPAPPRRLTVVVRHEDAPHFEAGEQVALIDEEMLRFAATDAEGRVVFEDVVPESAIRVFLCGTHVRETWMNVRPPATFDHTLTLSVPASAPSVVRVVDAVGRPVTGAEVDGNGSQFGRWTFCPIGRTDARGELRRRGLEDAQFRARASGRAPSACESGTRDAAGALAVTLALGSEAASVRGRVVDEHGKPCAAQLGTVALASWPHGAWFDAADARGEFALDWLSVGPVIVVARTNHVGVERRGLIRIEAPSAGRVELRITPGATLAATLTRAGGLPAGDAMVNARCLIEGVHEVPFGVFDERPKGSGQLDRTGLLPGRWLLRATIDGQTVQGIVDLVDGQATTWRGEFATDVDLGVRLLDERQMPLVGWVAQPTGAHGGPSGSAKVTDDQGVSEPGRWRFPADRPVTIAAYDRQGSLLMPHFPVFRMPGVVPTGGVVDIVVPDRCRMTHRVRGVVVGPDERPCAARVRVALSAKDFDADAVSTVDGVFTFGPYGPGVMWLIVESDGLPDLVRSIEVPVVGDLDLGSVRMQPAGALRFEILGDVVPNDLQLRLVSAGGREFAVAREGRIGTVDDLPCGPATLRGSSSSHCVPAVAIDVQPGAQEPIAVRCEAAPMLRVAIEIGDEARAQPAWSGTLRLWRGNERVVERGLERWFRGVVPNALEFAVAVPSGDYRLECVDAWGTRTLPVHVGATGGSVQIAR